MDHDPAGYPTGSSAPRRALATAVQDLAQVPFEILVNILAASPVIPRVVRLLLYRLAGIRATVADLWPGTWIRSRRLHLGPWVTINRGCVIDNTAPVVIGAGTRVGHGAAFITSTHRIGPPRERAGTRYDAGIVVGEGCWIGARAMILPGVRVSDGCVVAAGAVVNRDCEPDGFYAGVPARRVRDLPGQAPDGTGPDRPDQEVAPG